MGIQGLTVCGLRFAAANSSNQYYPTKYPTANTYYRMKMGTQQLPLISSELFASLLAHFCDVMIRFDSVSLCEFAREITIICRSTKQHWSDFAFAGLQIHARAGEWPTAFDRIASVCICVSMFAYSGLGTHSTWAQGTQRYEKLTVTCWRWRSISY